VLRVRAAQEPVDGVGDRLGVPPIGQVIDAFQKLQPGARHMLGQVASRPVVDLAIITPVDHQHRHADNRQQDAHITLGNGPQQVGRDLG
jgi:hypothetical protein